MDIRPGWRICALLALVVVIGLLVAGSRNVTIREVALRVPNQDAVALLGSSAPTVCEGPVTSPGPIRGVGIWGGSALGVAVVGVDVRDARTQMHVASGQIDATAPGEYVARLSRPVAAHRPLTICVAGILNTFSLSGGPTETPNVTMTGANHGLQFSLVLDNSRSLLGSLSTAFSRASLWRPSWVGSWTFWVLTFGVLGTFGLAVVAVMSADASDEDRERSDLQPGEDRPQPVA